jgi:hypothetical protein
MAQRAAPQPGEAETKPTAGKLESRNAKSETNDKIKTAEKGN